jgi:hypothetical protein
LSAKTSIQDVEYLAPREIVDGQTILEIFSDFHIRRFFTVSVSESEERGRHAHKKCSQWIVATKGSVSINLQDGISNLEVTLSENGKFLHIPPGIWSTQKYSAGAKTLVLCDLPFIEDDYIRKWEDFLAYKNGEV